MTYLIRFGEKKGVTLLYVIFGRLRWLKYQLDISFAVFSFIRYVARLQLFCNKTNLKIPAECERRAKTKSVKISILIKMM